MWIRAELFHDIRVAGGAGILADEIRRNRRFRLGRYRLLLASKPGSCEPGEQQKTRDAG